MQRFIFEQARTMEEAFQLILRRSVSWFLSMFCLFALCHSLSPSHKLGPTAPTMGLETMTLVFRVVRFSV